ncbi:hypothetical protein Tco_1164846 [Tanacetum coccineum]
MSESAKRHEENSILIKEIRASTDASIRNQGALIKTLEIQIGQMGKVLQERRFGSLANSTETNPRDHVQSISTIVEADSYPIRRASVNVMPLLTYLNLGLGELAHTKLIVELADKTVKYPKGIVENVLEDYFEGWEEKIFFKSVKPASSLIKRVYMLSLRERMELDLEARLIGETLVLNRSLDPFFEDYIELNDLNVPLELRRDQVDDLMPTIEEGEDKLEYKGNNVVGALMNIPIFVGTFSILMDFAVLEDMNAYRDEGMGDVIFGEPFFREVGINSKWFEGMIIIHNGNEEVTYQMVRSHPRFKHHTNEQCNKIPPLLKVSKEDMMNGISYSYQKLKSFYKGVLNLGPEYVRDVEMKEWLTRGHISVHETE